MRFRISLVIVSFVAMSWAADSLVSQTSSGSHSQDVDFTKQMESFSAKWNELGWNMPPGRRKYLRTPTDDSWKTRMEFLQNVAGGDERTVRQLVDALDSDDVATRIFAAQALGNCSAKPPTDKLIDKIKSDPSPAVQLYLVDSLGMHGVTDLQSKLGNWRTRNRDVRKHLAYVKEREGAKAKPEIQQVLRDWDPATIGTAKVGEEAPDFELDNLTGGKIKLSDYRGKKAVVLTFIYGDT